MPTDSSGTDDLNLSKDALKHAWSWFSLHAAQRMQAVNFFLIATAFLVAAYGTALTSRYPAIAMAVAVFGSWVSLCFNRLERRTRELVKAGEAPMRELQARLAERTKIPELRILDLVDTPKVPRTSYSRVFNTLHWTTLVAFAGGFGYAAYLFVLGTDVEVAATPVARAWLLGGVLMLGVGLVMLLTGPGLLWRVGGTALIVGDSLRSFRA